MERLKIFYSYAREDRALRVELGKHLATFVARGLCEEWHDAMIEGGQEWDAKIKEKLRTADFILLLISADFLSSTYIRSVEIAEAMRRHQAKEARVVPIVLRPCNFGGEVFSRLHGFPDGMKAATEWRSLDQAFANVADGLEQAFDGFRKEREAHASAGGNGATPETTAASKNSDGSPDSGPPAAEKPAGLQLSTAQAENRALAKTSTEGVRSLRELMTTNPRVKTFVAAEEDKLLQADEKLQTLVDYKNMHDYLHDLQFKCYNYIFQEAREVEDDVDWKLLVQPRKDLKVLVAAIKNAAAQPSLENEDFEWLQELERADEQLTLASREVILGPLKEAQELIKNILERMPPLFDRGLCRAAESLPLPSLHDALAVIRSKLSRPALEREEGSRFSAAVDVLPGLSDNVKALTSEHTQWQQIAMTLWTIDADIDRDLTMLMRRWPRLLDRLKKICAANSSVWAATILEAADGLDEQLRKTPEANVKEFTKWQKRVVQSYQNCATESSTRFYQVDLSLKRLCEDLRSLQSALAGILDEFHGRPTDAV